MTKLALLLGSAITIGFWATAWFYPAWGLAGLAALALLLWLMTREPVVPAVAGPDAGPATTQPASLPPSAATPGRATRSGPACGPTRRASRAPNGAWWTGAVRSCRRSGSTPEPAAQHSTMFTASPPRAVSLYFVCMSAPVSRIVLMTLSSDT